MTIKELSKSNALLEEENSRVTQELSSAQERFQKEKTAHNHVQSDPSAAEKEKQIKSLQVQVARLQQQLAVGF